MFIIILNFEIIYLTQNMQFQPFLSVQFIGTKCIYITVWPSLSHTHKNNIFDVPWHLNFSVQTEVEGWKRGYSNCHTSISLRGTQTRAWSTETSKRQGSIVLVASERDPGKSIEWVLQLESGLRECSGNRSREGGWGAGAGSWGRCCLPHQQMVPT